MKNADLERVAETQFHLRHRLSMSLRDSAITAQGRKVFGPYANFEEYWIGTYADRFFDMATFTRLGTAVETGLRRYHFEWTGTHPSDRAIFQRLVKPKELVALIAMVCAGYDLNNNPHFASMRELMVHRHLFAHRNGLADERFLADLELVTGSSPRSDLESHGYPDEEVFWFPALKRLPEFIEAGRGFFRELPEVPRRNLHEAGRL